MEVNIGEEIERVFRASEISVSAFGRKLSMDRNNVYKIFKRTGIHTDLLVRIGNALKHDFFVYYREQGDEPLLVKEDAAGYGGQRSEKITLCIEIPMDKEAVIPMDLNKKIHDIIYGKR